MLTIINNTRNFSPQIFAMDDPINETVLQQEFASLETLGQLQPDGVPDGSFAGKANQGAGFSQSQIALQCETGRHAAHRWVGQNRYIQAAGLIVAGERGGDFGHLHQRQNAFLHSGAAAGAADKYQRQSQPRRLFCRAGKFLPDHGTHRPGHEGEIGDAQHHWPAAYEPLAQHGRVVQASFLLLGLQALRIRDPVHEFERIDWPNVGKPFFKAARIEQLVNALTGRDLEMKMAFRADVEAILRLFAKKRGLALRALHPQAFGNTAALAAAVWSHLLIESEW